MKYFLIALGLIFASPAFSADDRFKYVDEQCARAHSRVDALLQFLYKFEGNLQPIKDSKIKSLKLQSMREFPQALTIAGLSAGLA